MIDINLLKEKQQVEFFGADEKSKRHAVIIEEINGGATSVVYKATLDDGTLVAVKAYREIESKMRNYQSELSALRLFSQFPDPQNPITPIFCGHSKEVEDAARFVVMEFITAPSLEEQYSALLSEKDACGLGIQLFEFINILHMNQKSYPDIKKENFRWQDSRLRVIDIGGLDDDPSGELVRRDLFQIGLIFLGQCVSKRPDFNRILYKISDQNPLDKIFLEDAAVLSGGIKYVFSRLFHDDYSQRYQTSEEVISDLNILYEAHNGDRKEVCKDLRAQIDQVANGVLTQANRRQKKKEIFIISSVLNLLAEKNNEVLKLLRDASDVYRQATLEEGIEKFGANPLKAKLLFQEIINGDDWESNSNRKDSVWRWLWACAAATNNPDTNAYLEDLLKKIDSITEKQVAFQSAEIPADLLNEPDFGNIQNQVTFLTYFNQKNFDQAEEFLKKLPDEYQESWLVELQELRDGLNRQKMLSDQLDKLINIPAGNPNLMALFLEVRQQLGPVNSASRWWGAILKAADSLIAMKEFRQAEEIIHIGFTYPGYPKELTEYLQLTRSLTMLQMDLALGNVVHAASVWSTQAATSETVKSTAIKQKLVDFRNEIYQKGDLQACDLLENFYAQNPDVLLDVDGENNKSWAEIKAGMESILKSNSIAVQSLFDKLTSDIPLLGKNLDLPVRLIFSNRPETDHEVIYKKMLLDDLYIQMSSISGCNLSELKERRDQTITTWNEKNRKIVPASSALAAKRKETQKKLSSYEKDHQTLQPDNGRSLEERVQLREEWRNKIILLLDDIFQLLCRDVTDKELQDWMQRALLMSGGDPKTDTTMLIAELKKRSPLKDILDRFVRGEADETEVKQQLQKEVFRDKNEFQNYMYYIANLVQLKVLEKEHRESNSISEKWDWVAKVIQSDLILPKTYWQKSSVRGWLDQLVNDVRNNSHTQNKELKKTLVLAIYADKAMKKCDEAVFSDEYLES